MIRAATFNAGTIDEEAQARRPTFFGRIASAIRQSRERAASREIERFVEMNGGKLTDSIEREISRRYGSSAY